MSGLTIDDIKPHVQAPPTADDTLLAGYLAAAETFVATYTRRDLAAEFPVAWPADLQHALKIIVARWYGDRGLGEFDGAAPEAAKTLMAAYRDMGA